MWTSMKFNFLSDWENFTNQWASLVGQLVVLTNWNFVNSKLQ